jgi:hypothetical protein
MIIDNKKFKASSNSENGEISETTIFHYRQNGKIIWADYSGGNIQKGHLIGLIEDNKYLQFEYHHVNLKNEILTGKCRSIISIQENGKLFLNEKWQWTCKDLIKGESVLVEI